MKGPSEDFFSKRDQIGKKQFLCSASLEYVVNTMLTSYNMGGVTFLFLRLDVRSKIFSWTYVMFQEDYLEETLGGFRSILDAKNTFGPCF